MFSTGFDPIDYTPSIIANAANSKRIVRRNRSSHSNSQPANDPLLKTPYSLPVFNAVVPERVPSPSEDQINSITDFITSIKGKISHLSSFLKNNDLHKDPITGGDMVYPRQRKSCRIVPLEDGEDGDYEMSPDVLQAMIESCERMGTKYRITKKGELKIQQPKSVIAAKKAEKDEKSFIYKETLRLDRRRKDYISPSHALKLIKANPDRTADLWFHVNFLHAYRDRTKELVNNSPFPIQSYGLEKYVGLQTRIPKFDSDVVLFSSGRILQTTKVRFILDIDSDGLSPLDYSQMRDKCEKSGIHPWMLTSTHFGGYHIVIQGDLSFLELNYRLAMACMFTDTDPSLFGIDLRQPTSSLESEALLHYLKNAHCIDNNYLSQDPTQHVARIPSTYNYKQNWFCEGGLVEPEYCWTKDKLDKWLSQFYENEIEISAVEEVEGTKEKEKEEEIKEVEVNGIQEVKMGCGGSDNYLTEAGGRRPKAFDAVAVLDDETGMSIDVGLGDRPEAADKDEGSCDNYLSEAEGRRPPALRLVNNENAIDVAKTLLERSGKQEMGYALPYNTELLEKALDVPELWVLQRQIKPIAMFLNSGLGWLLSDVPSFGISQIRLADILGVTQPYVSRMLKALVKCGYLERSEKYVKHSKSYDYCFGEKLRHLAFKRPSKIKKQEMLDELADEYEIGRSNTMLLADTRICYALGKSEDQIFDFITEKYDRYVERRQPREIRPPTSLRSIVSNWMRRKAA